VQVVSIKPTLKPPEIKRLKLKWDESLSKFAFDFNSRRYNLALVPAAVTPPPSEVRRCKLTL
jgi:hypothetical protein